MPRGRPRTNSVPETEEAPINLEEAKRRGLWAIHRVRKGFYACSAAGEHCAGTFVGWAIDKTAAKRGCSARARDDQVPEGGRHQLDNRSHNPAKKRVRS